MSKVLKVVAVVAGAVALVATGVGVFAAAGSKLAATAATVAEIATVVAGVASIGAALTYKPPPARGSIAQVLIAPDAPTPFVMGEGLVGGVLRHDTAYGPTLNKVPNPYRFMAIVLSGAGPVQAVVPQVDQASISSWYSGYLHTDTRLGACPDTALVPHPAWGAAPGWSADSKLSGKACVGWSLLFDKDGKRFASGVPQLAALVQGIKVYDPRLDSTFPGGSGACRLGNEATYVYSDNPALHAGTYAFGRYQNAKLVGGVGLPVEAIDWANIAAWANTCQANGWTLFGAVYEPGDRWANLKDIALAGGAVPLVSGGVLSFHYAAPRVTLDTVTDADLADGDLTVTATASWRERINAVVPKYRSPVHNWEMVDAEKVTVAGYVAEDGEEKAEVFAYNLVKNKDQAAQLAAYRLVDGRELQPIEITYGPRLFAYGPGDCLQLNHPELGLDGPFVVLTRRFDPSTMTVTFTFTGETPAKHAFALGRTGVAPPSPALSQTGIQRDEQLSASLLNDARAAMLLAEARGKLTVGGDLPALASSNFGDTHVADDGTFYDRVNEGGILLDGKAITLAGFRPRIGWTKSSSQPLFTASQVAMVAEDIANQAINAIDDLADDGILSVNEKVVTLIPENSRLEGAWSALSAAAATAAVPTTVAATKRAAWIALRDTLSPMWNDITQDTPVNRAAYRTALIEFDQSLEDLNKAVIEGITAARQVTVAAPIGLTISCDHTGTVKPGQLPAVLTPVVRRGGTDIRTSNAVSYSISAPSQINATINNTTGSADKGRITIGASFSGPGTVQLTVLVDGVSYGPFPVGIDRLNDPVPAIGGSGGGAGPAYDSTFSSVSATSFVAISDELGPLNLSAGQKLVVTAPLDYFLNATNTASRSMLAMAQYWNGSSWIDFPGGPVTGTAATWNQADFSGDAGSIAVLQEQTGLPAGAYKVRLVARVSAGGAGISLSVFSGTMTFTVV